MLIERRRITIMEKQIKLFLEFLENDKRVSKNTLAGKVYICGHSKGGNLAIYSTFHRSDEQIMRIEKVYSFDGPGFMKEVVAGAEYKRIIPKIESYLPQSSIVGMIMYSGEDYNIVHSEAHGLMQHFVLSWNVIGNYKCRNDKWYDNLWWRRWSEHTL